MGDRDDTGSEGDSGSGMNPIDKVGKGEKEKEKKLRGRPKGSKNKPKSPSKEQQREHNLLTGRWGITRVVHSPPPEKKAEERTQRKNEEIRATEKGDDDLINLSGYEEETTLVEDSNANVIKETETEITDSNMQEKIDTLLRNSRKEVEWKQKLDDIKKEMQEEWETRSRQWADKVTNTVERSMNDISDVSRKYVDNLYERQSIDNENKWQKWKKEVESRMGNEEKENASKIKDMEEKITVFIFSILS